MRNIIKAILVIFTIGIVACSKKTESDNLRLWYNQPANDWMTEALPIGNGYTGAMFFGDIEEQIQFSEESLWAGGPNAHPGYNGGLREGAWENLEEIRRLINEGNLQEAHQLTKETMTGVTHKSEKSNQQWGDYGSQQPMGDLFVKTLGIKQMDNYQRELDISNAIGRVSFSSNGTQHRRQFFANYPQNVLCYSFSNDNVSGETYQIRFGSPHVTVSEIFEDNTLVFNGKVQDNGLAFETCFKINAHDGNVTYKDGVVEVRNCKKLEIIHVAATGYKNEYPHYSGNDFKSANAKKLAVVSTTTLDELYKEHQEDYKQMFDRVTFTLGDDAYKDSISTDIRLVERDKGTVDNSLESLFFQYCRYLIISSSRPGTMPMHLQGKWNYKVNPSWACDYHMNINEQMLYWPVEVANLAESHLPLFDYMQTLVEPGEITAREFYNARGWTVATMNNAYGYTSPGWGIPWGHFPAGAAWLCQHLWEHFQFSQDTLFLSEVALPMMKGASLFWVDYLVVDNDGNLVSSPSYSPEHGGISGGASMDHQIAWDVLNNTIKAYQILGIQDESIDVFTTTRDQILEPQIGRWGQLQEWKEDVDDPKDTHRHLSHMYALHPGNQISLLKTPKLAEAAKVSINARGDGGTGWSLAWKTNMWARLKDGNRAYKLFSRLLQPASKKSRGYASGIYLNMLCTHPPFQLDGNMGGCAGMAEMLLQSHTGTIELLPALPATWNSGSVTGIKARGGYEVSMDWKEGKLYKAEIKAHKAGHCKVYYSDKLLSKEMDAGEKWVLKF
jgi:alpha-L-fucosidase 2